MRPTCVQFTGLGLWLVLMLPHQIAAQQARTDGSTGNPRTVPRREAVSARDTFPAPQGNQQNPPQAYQPLVFISGNVVQEDGTAPPYGAVIEINCGGVVTREAIVNQNGQFSFQIGGDNRAGSVIPDASRGYDSYANGMSSVTGSNGGPGFSGIPMSSPARLIGCEVRAQLSGYRSTSLYIKESPMQGMNDVGTIVVYRADRVLGNTVSLTNLAAPKGARKTLEQAQKAVRKKRLPEAENLFKAAIRAYPKYAEAWFDLGLVYEHEERLDEATNAYGEAVKADSTYVRPFIRLAYLAYERKSWQEAADVTEKVLALDPVTLIDSYFISAVANMNVGNLELAEKRAKQGLSIDFSERFPQFHLVLADVSSRRQDAAGAVKELQGYLKSAPNASNANLVRIHLDRLEAQLKTGVQ